MDMSAVLAWLDREIDGARLNLAMALKAERDNDYSDALESMDRAYEEGFLAALEFVKGHFSGLEA